MRRLTFASLTAAALLAAPVASQAGSSNQVFYPGCAAGIASSFKPRDVIVACGDGNFQLRKLAWSSWTNVSAKATGTAKVNTCTPNCAQGRFKSYPASVTVTKPKSCNGVKVWSKLAVTFTDKIPSGLKHTDKQTLVCPQSQGQQG